MKHKNKPVKFILILIIIGIILFLIFLWNYKIKIVNVNTTNGIKILEELKNIEKKDYQEQYKQYIVNDIEVYYEYEIVNLNDISYGNIYIDKEQHLNIQDKYNKKQETIKSDTFKTLYVVESDNISRLDVYLINTKEELYKLSIEDCNIANYTLNKIDTDYKIKKFTNLKYDSYLDIYISDIIILADDGNMYNPINKILYDDNILNVLNEYLIYKDSTISNYDGKLLKDNNGNNYKIKYIFNINIQDVQIEDFLGINVAFVTEDNKIIYVKNDKIYEISNIKEIKHNEDELTIIYDNNKQQAIKVYRDINNYGW